MILCDFGAESRADSAIIPPPLRSLKPKIPPSLAEGVRGVGNFDFRFCEFIKFACESQNLIFFAESSADSAI
ncbi:hypothetical protein ACWIUD_08940 [Helicobacter sp. 23-1044]